MDDFQRRLTGGAMEDNRAGKLTRREFLRLFAIMGGGTVLGFASLGDLACGFTAGAPGTGPGQGSPSGVTGSLVALDEPPDILFIVIDTLRADHVSSYGYARPTSPTIDTLAGEGALFEMAVSTAPYTGPSHASLLTGCYPHEHGLQWTSRRKPTLDGRYPTLPEALQSVGYRTAAFSANHFWFTREQGFGRGFHWFDDTFRSPMRMALRTVYGRQIEDAVIKGVSEDYPWRIRANDINNSALAWLKDNQQQPFFVFLNYFDVHDPYLPPQPYRGKFSAEEDPGGVINSYQDRFQPEVTPRQLQDEIDAYDGAISYVDDQLSQLLTRVQQWRGTANLLVIITSDHGEAFGEHGAFLHPNSVYLEEIHVPLVLWQPGRIPAGVRVTQPVTNAALAATIMDLVDRGGPGEFPHQSLARYWQGRENRPATSFPLVEMEHWPWWHHQSPTAQGAMRSLLSPEYHYIEHDSLGAELYDWRRDPKEEHNLADSDEGRAAIEQFQQRLAEDYWRVWREAD